MREENLWEKVIKALAREKSGEAPMGKRDLEKQRSKRKKNSRYS
jgi:hypothetical protein